MVQTRLEEYLTLADVLPLDMVENTEKSREKDRRQVTREEKILQQKEEHVSNRPDLNFYWFVCLKFATGSIHVHIA